MTKFPTVLGASPAKNSILMMPPFSMVISAVWLTRAGPFWGSAGLGAWARAAVGTAGDAPSATTRAVSSSSRVLTCEFFLDAGIGKPLCPSRRVRGKVNALRHPKNPCYSDDMQERKDIRNVAIIAHVDHGKTDRKRV